MSARFYLPKHGVSRHFWKAFAACLALGFFSSCGLRLPIPDASPVPQRVEVNRTANAKISTPALPQDVLIWLTADEYHTGMIFPYDWLLESGFTPPHGFGNPRYVAMSWGNQDAYSPTGLDTTWKYMRVLFTPTPSVMEMIPANWNVAEVCPHQRIWRKLVPRDMGPRLAHFLNECTQKHPDGTPVVLCPSSWGNGVQLKCRHSYFIPRVCNVWTVQTLEATGGSFNPWFALTANGLIRQAEKPPNSFEQIWAGKR